MRRRASVLILVVGLLVVPLQMTLIPILRLFTELGLTGSFLGIWLAHTGYGLPFGIYLLRNFFGALPREMFESAYLDGAGPWTVFFRLVLPTSVPALASLAIFQFMWVWNDLLIALVYLGGQPSVAPMPVTISNPAAPGVGHQWAYLPDVARTMVELLARRDTLPAFASFHMAGHWDATGRQMAEAIQRVAARHGRAPRITLCMIARDEERFLPECLDRARAAVDEIVIVDTGSKDRTVAIAQSFGAKVLHVPWDDDFSAPRNAGIAAATGDWILVLDADEFLRQKTIKDENDAFAFLKAHGMEVTLDVDVESFRVACTPVIANNPDLFLPELVKMARATPT